MNQFFQTRKVAATIVLVGIIVLGLTNMVYAFPVLSEVVRTAFADDSMAMRSKIATIEASVEEEFFGKNMFIEGYGLVQSVLGKQTIKEFSIAKDEDGNLHYVYFQTAEADVTGIGEATVSLAEVAEAAGAEFLCLMPPSKMIEGETTFEAGVPVPDENAATDDFLAYLTEHEVDHIDLREGIAESGIPSEDWFYSTDHHWTTQTAFWGFTQLVAYLESGYGISLDPDGFYTDLAHYNQILYEDDYIGSLGREVGAVYGGVDDFTLIYPKFTTSFSYFATNGDDVQIDMAADLFERSLLAVDQLNTDLDRMEADADKYFAYLWGDYGYASIANDENENGIRVLFIKDSYGVPLAAFCATTCAEVDLIDPRWYEGSIEDAVAAGDYDAVVVCVSAPNLTEEFFTFQ